MLPRAGQRPAGKPRRVTTTHVFEHVADGDVRAARGCGGIPSGCPRKHGFRTPYLFPFSGAGGETGKLGCVHRVHGCWWKPRAHGRAPLFPPARTFPVVTTTPSADGRGAWQCALVAASCHRARFGMHMFWSAAAMLPRAGRRPAGKPGRMTTTHVFVRFADEDVGAARGCCGIPSGCPRKHGFRTPYLLPFSGAGG
ncbi:hypothetical protein HRbin30_01845 [bacterium HR30]|nr:hypothetical protein HRbin30_01845 [bacterium HR30]